MEIKLLKAEKGDCIHLRYGKLEKTNIIIDSGTKNFGEKFFKYIKSICSNNEVVDALFLTHIDDDHIGGFFKALKMYDNISQYIKCVYINNGKIKYSHNSNYSAKTASNVIKLIKKYNIKTVDNVICGKKFCLGEACITILTPKLDDMNKVKDILLEHNKKSNNLYYSYNFKKDINNCIFEYKPDNSISNKASISFLLKYNDKNYLFLGDANIDDILQSFKKLKCDNQIEYIKLSHHGSIHNINNEFLNSVNCNKFLLTTNKYISKEVLKLLIDSKKKCYIYCNYNWWKGINYFTKNDINNYLNNNKLIIEQKDAL